MIIDYFPATIAADGNGITVKNATAQVYALADANLSTPLALTDLQGVPMPELRSSDLGIYPAFRVVAGVMQIVVVSGSLRTPMTSLSVYANAAEAAAAMASGNAGAAASSAQAAELARLNAVAAQAAAVEAAAEATAVGNTNDAITEGLIKSATSKTATALGAAIAQQVEGAVSGLGTTRIISHGWAPATSRGGSDGNVLWVGWVQPDNLIEGADIWLKPVVVTPPDVPTGELLARFRADAITGVATDSPVTTWPSIVGSHVMAATGGPLLKTDGTKKWVETDGVNDHLSDDTLDRTQPACMVVVAKLVVNGTGKYIVSGTSAAFHSLGTDASGDANFQTYAGTALAATVVSDANWHVFIASVNGASSELMIDGVVARTGNAGALQADGFRIGSSPGLGTFSAVGVAEAIVYDRLLTTEEKASVSATLAAYHGIG